MTTLTAVSSGRRDQATKSTSGRPRTRLRLTMRGKVVLVAACLLIPFLALTAGRAWASADAPAPRAVVTVESGDTLWALAKRASPGVDPRETMAELMRLNDLDSPALVAGQQLVLPAGSS